MKLDNFRLEGMVDVVVTKGAKGVYKWSPDPIQALSLVVYSHSHTDNTKT